MATGPTFPSYLWSTILLEMTIQDVYKFRTINHYFLNLIDGPSSESILWQNYWCNKVRWIPGMIIKPLISIRSDDQQQSDDNIIPSLIPLVNTYSYANVPYPEDPKFKVDPTGYSSYKECIKDHYNSIALVDSIISILTKNFNEDDYSNYFQILKTQIEPEWIYSICATSMHLFAKEPTCISDLTSPIHIIGDLNGSFPSLLQVFSSFISSAATEKGCNEYNFDRLEKEDTVPYLFLGNYVNRGSYSLSTILLLLCLKIKYPTKIWMLRGHLEDQMMAELYGLDSEIENLYSKVTKSKKNFFSFLMSEENVEVDEVDDGAEDPAKKITFWIASVCFSAMPYAAMIDSNIFCSHGGISPFILQHGFPLDDDNDDNIFSKKIDRFVEYENQKAIVQLNLNNDLFVNIDFERSIKILSFLWSEPNDGDEDCINNNNANQQNEDDVNSLFNLSRRGLGLYWNCYATERLFKTNNDKIKYIVCSNKLIIKDQKCYSIGKQIGEGLFIMHNRRVIVISSHPEHRARVKGGYILLRSPSYEDRFVPIDFN